jgi:hypothetical protein
MLQSDTHKATITLKAETLGDLNEALDAIANASGNTFAVKATISTTITVEAGALSDLGLILDGIATAVAFSAVEVTAKAPLAAYRQRRLDATPMERAIHEASER